MTRLIAHRVSKTAHSTRAELQLGDQILPETAETQGFVEELRKAITAGNPVAGRFHQPAGVIPRFQQRLLRYLARPTEAEFISLSRDASEALVEEMRQETLVTGGYVVFVEHSHGADTFLINVILSTRARANFNEHLRLVQATTLDTEHLRHAGRIRLGGVAANEEGAIHYVSRSSEGNYFRRFLGCEPLTDSTAQGHYLHTALRRWADSQRLTTEATETLMSRTFFFWKECWREKRPMTLTALANTLSPENPQPLLEHLGAEPSRLAGEFSPPAPSVMKKFVKFAFNKSGLRLEFNLNEWLDNIVVTGTTVTIKHAPSELIQEINAEKHVGQ